TSFVVPLLKINSLTLLWDLIKHIQLQLYLTFNLLITSDKFISFISCFLLLSFLNVGANKIIFVFLSIPNFSFIISFSLLSPLISISFLGLPYLSKSPL